MSRRLFRTAQLLRHRSCWYELRESQFRNSRPYGHLVIVAETKLSYWKTFALLIIAIHLRAVAPGVEALASAGGRRTAAGDRNRRFGAMSRVKKSTKKFRGWSALRKFGYKKRPQMLPR